MSLLNEAKLPSLKDKIVAEEEARVESLAKEEKKSKKKSKKK